MSQLGFFGIANRYAELDAKNDPLLTLDTVVPWESFRDRLETVWRKPDVERKPLYYARFTICPTIKLSIKFETGFPSCDF